MKEKELTAAELLNPLRIGGSAVLTLLSVLFWTVFEKGTFNKTNVLWRVFPERRDRHDCLVTFL